MKMTRPAFSIYPLLLLCSLWLAGCDPNSTVEAKGQQATVDQAQGTWLLINYWAVWCKPCIEEIPELNAFAREHQKQVTVFGVNFDGSTGETLKAQVNKLQIKFPTLSTDPARQLGYERPTVLPTTVLINPQGELHRILLGPQTADSLAQALEP